MSTHGKSVLIAENDSTSAELLSLFLNRSGYAVNVVRAGDSLLAELEARRFHVLLLDLSLDGMDRDELLGRLARLPARPATVIYSGWQTDTIESAARKIGAAAWMQKPLGLDELLAVVAKAADGGGHYGRDGDGRSGHDGDGHHHHNGNGHNGRAGRDDR